MDSIAQWTLALVAGGGAAGLTKTLMNLLRGGSTATTGGLANPLFALLELAVSVGLSILAITLPLVAGAVVIGLLSFAIYKSIVLIQRVPSR
jgi:ABC-type thiamin/hydroxymethylpyrimidine transport system permease subunit